MKDPKVLTWVCFSSPGFSLLPQPCVHASLDSALTSYVAPNGDQGMQGLESFQLFPELIISTVFSSFFTEGQASANHYSKVSNCPPWCSPLYSPTHRHFSTESLILAFLFRPSVFSDDLTGILKTHTHTAGLCKQLGNYSEETQRAVSRQHVWW